MNKLDSRTSRDEAYGRKLRSSKVKMKRGENELILAKAQKVHSTTRKNSAVAVENKSRKGRIKPILTRKTSKQITSDRSDGTKKNRKVNPRNELKTAKLNQKMKTPSRGRIKPENGTNTKMNVEHIRTFSCEESDDQERTRFTDVVFVDKDHILALDDKFFMWQAYGYRACLFRLDGTLVAELPLPGYPWSVVMLHPMTAVITIRDKPSKGLLWVSIDVPNKSMEVVKNKVFEDTFGVTFDGRNIIASHFEKEYLTVLTEDGEDVSKIPIERGRIFRCLSMGKNGNLLCLDNLRQTVAVIDQRGKNLISLSTYHLRKPSALAIDLHNNIYVGNTGDLGVSNVVQFDTNGKYVKTLCHLEDLRGLAVSRDSDLLAISHEHSISIYKLKTGRR
ncbi:hypothetical protein FSP39_003166 [Pinctada imbricata]|uniref:Uncharacterized protein n=1 Tax=Pinctada imbricata TaxID=66713 RepID=A0AA89BVW0_PINIB|nr:hypothetical protein FSP39_003166 [Pinctada imbricata]